MWLREKIRETYQRYKSHKILLKDDCLSITDLYKLCYPHPNLPSSDCSFSNGSYGHAFHLKRFAGIDRGAILNCTIEHGMNITRESVCAIEVSHPVSTILTYSNHRKKIIERLTDMHAVVVGPYIAYAEDYVPAEKLAKLKNRLGKTLLVFPSHGIAEYELIYDYKSFVDRIKEISQDFNTVMVCVYYHEINLQKHKPYEDAGFMVVSAGVGDNRHFLSRLKMIIQLSDAVIGNTFTTGLAYALYFDKPIYLFRQNAQFINTGNNNVSQLYVNHEVLDSLYEVCSDSSFKQLDKQKRWGEYYFGFNKVKTKIELRNILLQLIRK